MSMQEAIERGRRLQQGAGYIHNEILATGRRTTSSLEILLATITAGLKQKLWSEEDIAQLTQPSTTEIEAIPPPPSPAEIQITQSETIQPQILESGLITLDLKSRRAVSPTVPEGRVLSPLRAKLLETILQAQPEAATWRDLSMACWGIPDVDKGRIKTVVQFLKSDLKEPKPETGRRDRSKNWIQSVNGIGFRIVGPISWPV